MIWATSWKSALYQTLIWSEYLVFYLVIRYFLEATGSYKILFSCLTIMLLVIALPAIIEYAAFLYIGGSTSLGIRFSKYGEQFLLLYPLIAAGILRLDGKRFFYGIGALTAMWLFMVSTLSRTNFVLFILGTVSIGFLIFFFRQFQNYRKKFLFLITALVGSFILLNSIAFLAVKPELPIVGRILDTASISYSNNFRKLMIPISLEMIADHPIIGIGAGNFGIQFNHYRKIYGNKNPTDVNLLTAERELAERAHNEYLQVFTELGIVGLIIFLFFLSSVAFMSVLLLKSRHRFSLFSVCALLGLILFLMSSAVSSFSFRFMQNGLVFFIVLAVAVKLSDVTKISRTKNYISSQNLRFLSAIGVSVCLILITYCGIRLASAVYTRQAVNTSNFDEALPLYQKAIYLDDENPNPDYFLGVTLINNKRYEESIPYFKEAISKGLGTSSTYSYLATADILAGNPKEAVEDFADAVKLYPRSIFVRTRYAYLLQQSGQMEESKQEFNLAAKLNSREAKTWWSLLNYGLPETTKRSFRNDDYIPVENLFLYDCVDAIRFEREILNPGEKTSFDFNSLSN